MKFNKNKPYIDPRYFLYEAHKEEMPKIFLRLNKELERILNLKGSISDYRIFILKINFSYRPKHFLFIGKCP